MSDKKRILVVDDSPNEVRILMELLKDEYAVVAATSGEKAIEICNGENKPDLVLMDVTMEPMNGYEACEKIHENHASLPVIFVSANTQTDEILNGFSVGGVDYITKPIEEEILLSKINMVLKFSAKQQFLMTQHKEASDLVMNAIASAGKLSVVLNFLRSGLKVTSQAELAKHMVLACREYDLQGAVQLRGEQEVNLTTHGEVNPLEQELLSRSVHMDSRIVEKGPRMIICFDSVSILLKNIPIDNPELHGELRDYLMIVAEDAHNLNIKIGLEMNVQHERSAMVAKVLNESQQALSEFETYQKEHKENSIKIMDALMNQIEKSYFNMGLTDEQEDTISKIVQDKVHESLEHMEGGMHVDEQLKAITQSLGEIARSL